MQTRLALSYFCDPSATVKGSVSSRIPGTCRLLANLCLSPFSWPMKRRQQRQTKRLLVQGMLDETDPLKKQPHFIFTNYKYTKTFQYPKRIHKCSFTKKPNIVKFTASFRRKMIAILKLRKVKTFFPFLVAFSRVLSLQTNTKSMEETERQITSKISA